MLAKDWDTVFTIKSITIYKHWPFISIEIEAGPVWKLLTIHDFTVHTTVQSGFPFIKFRWEENRDKWRQVYGEAR